MRKLLGDTLICLAVLAVGFPPARAATQEVRGEVIDKLRRPVSGAYIGIFDEDRNLVVGEIADDDGVFSVTAPAEGTYYILMSRIGYRSLYDGPFDLVDDGALELFAVMHPFPVAVDGLDIEVEASVARLVEVGFYERQAKGFGHFLEREELEQYTSRTLSEAFRKLPGVQIAGSTPPGISGPGALVPGALVMTRNGQLCSPTVYIDGTVVGHGGNRAGMPIRPDERLMAGDLEAVEVYTTTAGQPLEYQASGGCGLVLIWSRHTALRRVGR